jgi:hypothetical protein
LDVIEAVLVLGVYLRTSLFPDLERAVAELPI